jgi:hypothetical protein
MEHRDPKAINTTIREANVKPALRYNVETWGLTKRNISKIQGMDMTFLRRIKGKIGGDGFTMKFLEKMEFRMY